MEKVQKKYGKGIEKEMGLLQNGDSVSWLTVMEVSMETGALLSSKFGTQGDYVESVPVE